MPKNLNRLKIALSIALFVVQGIELYYSIRHEPDRI
ncbi:hypothetical protein HMPREF9708_01247 [Facklamia languida CCUG 37842]|uniref:Uncharacterized protein n=1 Tax=Facklamia languida CCUG 37842 TaxID=883113 RepID=H3NK58_9LACT|nr:hypothetical protein HMPREF9708_01247 [Facklamia languida CCUG 37842]